MRSPQLSLSLASLSLLISICVSEQGLPTAVKRQSPDSGAKILPEHLAFAPVNILLPNAHSSFSFNSPDPDHDPTKRFSPAYGSIPELSHNAFRRAAEAVNLLQRRSACPPETNSCADIGSPNKCCQDGTYCTDVSDTDVGHVACCPEGESCGGGVGKCPDGATTCDANLGGGCCIPGYVCQGVGCVLESKATSTKTETAKTTKSGEMDTITTTQTTEIEGEPTTVIATVVVTRTAKGDTETKTVTKEITESAGAPFRPTLTSSSEESSEESSSSSSSAEETSARDGETTTTNENTQTGCPTGFYGCLATHGGGCCRTDRDCETFDCPAPKSTTVVSGEETIVVPATNLPDPTSATCADGWFICGKSAGPREGCCPSGYECGTASCFATGTEGGEKVTGSVAKELPGDEGDAGSGLRLNKMVLGGVVGGLMIAMGIIG